MPEKVQRMLPYQCSLLLYTELHQGVQRVLQIRGFLLLQQEIKMFLLILCSLRAGWQEKLPLR
jgi:hypothetical protein